MHSSLTSSPVVPFCVLPAHELARLRNSAAAATTSPSSVSLLTSSSTSIDAHRRALKHCSDARIAGWADTVEAKWEKKLRAKIERQEAREKERERVDAEEAELERLETLATLARAKALMFEQSDSFKAFRSAQRYADILEVRDGLLFFCPPFPFLSSFHEPPWPALSLVWSSLKHIFPPPTCCPPMHYIP